MFFPEYFTVRKGILRGRRPNIFLKISTNKKGRFSDSRGRGREGARTCYFEDELFVDRAARVVGVARPALTRHVTLLHGTLGVHGAADRGHPHPVTAASCCRVYHLTLTTDLET